MSTRFVFEDKAGEPHLTIEVDHGSVVKNVRVGKGPSVGSANAYTVGVRRVPVRPPCRRPGLLPGTWMKLLLALLAVIAVLSLYLGQAYGSGPVPGTGTTGLRSGLECEDIKDADGRHFCRAVANHDPNECELIKRADLRHECRVYAGKR
jgi:hypothetical protein